VVHVIHVPICISNNLQLVKQVQTMLYKLLSVEYGVKQLTVLKIIKLFAVTVIIIIIIVQPKNKH
jgi:hypothetical protein